MALQNHGEDLFSRVTPELEVGETQVFPGPGNKRCRGRTISAAYLPVEDGGGGGETTTTTDAAPSAEPSAQDGGGDTSNQTTTAESIPTVTATLPSVDGSGGDG